MTQEEGIAAILAHPECFADCILCGRRAALIGIFFPTHSVLYGGRPDKQRMIGYGLCNDCEQAPDKLPRIEATFAAQTMADGGA